MDLESLEIRNELLHENDIRDMLDKVSADLEEAFNAEHNEKREKDVELAEKENITPPEAKEKPEKRQITLEEVNNVLFELESLYFSWNVESPEIISENINLIRNVLNMFFFHGSFEKIKEKAIRDLEVASGALMWNLEFETAKKVYPIFQVLNESNDYLIQTQRIESTEENITISKIFNLLREIVLSPSQKETYHTDNLATYAKVQIYKMLLENLGNNLPPISGSEDAFQDEVDAEIVKSLITKDDLINMNILFEEEARALERGKNITYLTKYEKARAIGERAEQISKNAPLKTDPGDLIDPILIAEKELSEGVMPVTICRPFPDGTSQAFCLSTLSKTFDDFYTNTANLLNSVSLEDLYTIAAENGYGLKVKKYWIGLLNSFTLPDERLGEYLSRTEPELIKYSPLIPEKIANDLFFYRLEDFLKLGIPEADARILKENVERDFGGEYLRIQTQKLSTLSRSEQEKFIKNVRNFLELLDNDELKEPIHILSLLLPWIKTPTNLLDLLAKDFSTNFFSLYKNYPYVRALGSAQVDVNDVPRHLTDGEIEDILSAVPPIFSVSKQHSMAARESLIDRFRTILIESLVCPSAISEIKNKIQLNFSKSRVDPGKAVGITAANALSEQFSQMTLNSFHSAGSSRNMSSGIKAISELVFARKARRNPSCLIAFKKRLSFEELLNKQSEIVETTVADLIEEDVVLNLNEVNREFLPRKFYKMSLEELAEYIEKHNIKMKREGVTSYTRDDYLEALSKVELWWYKYYDKLNSMKNKPDKILRLYLDTVAMVERKVTMTDIVHALKKGQGKEGIPDSSIMIVHSPTSEGILDIWPNPQYIKGPVKKLEQELVKGRGEASAPRPEYSIDVFIDIIILDKLDKIRIKGISKIRGLFPENTTVWSIIAKEAKANLLQKERWGLDVSQTYWVMTLDINQMYISVVKLEYLLEFLESLGYGIIIIQEDKLVIQYQGKNEARYRNKVPSTVRKEKLDVAKEEWNDVYGPETKGKKEISKESRSILDTEKYYYFTSSGSNLIGLTTKEIIDPVESYCNNIYTITAKYGVEAGRQFFIKELYDTITEYGGYVNPRNILLLADFLFSQGVYLGANYTGMSAGSTGFLTLASFEKSLQTLQKGAIFGEKESLSGVSAAIAAGKPIKMGTGFMDIITEKVDDVVRDIATNPKDLTSESMRSQLTRAFASGVSPFEEQEAFDPVASKMQSLQQPVERPIPKAKTPKAVRVEEREGKVKCTPQLVTGASDLLEEAVESVIVGESQEPTFEEEWQVDSAEIPNEIEQQSLTIEPITEEMELPAHLTSDIALEPIEPLGKVERVEEEIEEREEELEEMELPIAKYIPVLKPKRRIT
jgi:DNA-directed RNA polymerase I, II, and III subunit RPABC2